MTPGDSDRDVLVARRGGALNGHADVPGDKSISHRALIIGALAEGETVIAGLNEGKDVHETIGALRGFGVRVERFGPGRWRVFGGEWRSPEGSIDCGNSGTSARLLAGAAAGFDLTARFTGDASLQRRPMRRLTAPLEAMGADLGGADTLPFTLRGRAAGPIRHCNDPPSAQVKSAILLAGLRSGRDVSIVEPRPTRDHTEILLRQFGAEVGSEHRSEGLVVSLGNRRDLAGQLVSIPADPSSAAFLLTAAAIVPGSDVTVRDMLLNPLRSGFVMAMQRMGCDVQLGNVRGCGGETIGDVRVRHSRPFGADFSAEEIPSMIDEIPALAILAAFAGGQSRIAGLAELRHKESDRLSAIRRGLAACGVEVREDGDALEIIGGPVSGGASIDTLGDHRIAMAFLVLGLAAKHAVTVDGAAMIATSFPDFAASLRALGAGISVR